MVLGEDAGHQGANLTVSRDPVCGPAPRRRPVTDAPDLDHLCAKRVYQRGLMQKDATARVSLANALPKENSEFPAELSIPRARRGDESH